MAFGDSLNWMACPAVIRHRVRNYVLSTIAISLAALALILLRDPLNIPREPWGRYGPLVLALIPLFIMWPMFFLGRRRLRTEFNEARGRLCMHCAYNLAPMGERGICPECGNAFDAHVDEAMWTKAGFTCEK